MESAIEAWREREEGEKGGGGRCILQGGTHVHFRMHVAKTAHHITGERRRTPRHNLRLSQRLKPLAAPLDDFDYSTTCSISPV